MKTSFNPCFNGSWSERGLSMKLSQETYSFNPCFNGSWSESLIRIKVQNATAGVSILVLMEVGLRGHNTIFGISLYVFVSILVLMEVGLRDGFFNFIAYEFHVSILVLMEVGLRV